MKDYKSTVNLPKTNFPMKASLSDREPSMLKRWYDLDIYGTLRKIRENSPEFIYHDGPPYANGDIHLGHAFGKILRDIVVKEKTLSGMNVKFIPGWDCHGLPIELQVEKKYGKATTKSSKKEFRDQCRKYAGIYVEKQKESFKRLGVFADWDNPYITMNPQYEADIIRSLATIIENGHVTRGFKPVHWCVECGSALAEAEVEYQNKHSPSIDVGFRVLDEDGFLRVCHHVDGKPGDGDMFVVIWTTTPWSLSENQAVALSADLDYAVVQCETKYGQQRLIIADELLGANMIKYGIENYRVIAYCKGKDLEGFVLQHPFIDKVVPIVLAKHVSTETGTGAVHTAPAHGVDDYLVGKEYYLSIQHSVGPDGRFTENAKLVSGKNIYEANDIIIDTLNANGLLYSSGRIEHSFPHCWRHKTPLMFLATPQWFISMDQNAIRYLALNEIKKVKWIPAWGETRIRSMVETRPDWCISRQRIWGVPIALFVNKKTGIMHPDSVKLMKDIADRVEKEGIDFWDTVTPEEFLGEEGTDYQKVTDTLDVWFDSGVSHSCVVAKHSTYPSDLYLEGSDQHRGWFQSSLITGCAMYGYAPYKTVLTHGFTVDENGHKMSKSLGNVISPQDIVKNSGADILRLWVCATDYQSDLTISQDILRSVSDNYRRIRNTVRFLLGNLDGFNPESNCINWDNMLELDKWAIDKTAEAQSEIRTAYSEYDFHKVYQRIYNFCALDMGSFYLDIIKDRLYTTKPESIARRSAQTAMYHIAESIVRWIAPILSFTADEIWQYLPGKREESVFYTTWYEKLRTLSENDYISRIFWQKIIDLRDLINKEIESLRSSDILGSSLEADVVIYADKELSDILNLLEDELRFVLITSSASVLPIEDSPIDAKETSNSGIKLIITKSPHEKCVRCWHRLADIRDNKNHQEICNRCIENISDGSGETRRFA